MAEKKKEKKDAGFFGSFGKGLLGNAERALKGRKDRLDAEMNKALGGTKKKKRK